MSFLNELKRRNVIRVAAGYIVLAWLVVQVVETIFPAFGYGDETIRLVVIGFAVGFIPVVVLAWVFEWTPEGIRRDDGDISKGASNLAVAKRWDRVVMVILAVAVAFFIVENILDEDSIVIEPAIVVLPFDGHDQEPGTEYLGGAIAEGVYTSLTRIPQLVVSAWPTVNRLAEEGMDEDQIVDTLNAANSLRGTLSMDGDRIEIRVRLVATESNRAIWEESFVGTTADMLDMQHEITAAVAENMRLGATGVLYEARPANPDAHRLTLQAWSTLYRVNLPDKGSIAAALLQEALAIDPEYVPALNALSYATVHQVDNGTVTPSDAKVIYKDVQERVTAIDYEDGVQNVYVAWGLFWDNNEPAHANQHLQIALRTGLNDGESLRVLAGFARRTGNLDAAFWFAERALAVDPTCENCVWQQTENLFYMGRFDEAIEAKKRFQALGGGGYANHAYMLLALGKPTAALELLDGTDVDDVYAAPLRAMAYHALGDAAGFTQSVDELEQLGGARTQSFLAEVYAFTGDIDRAFEALHKALEQGGRLTGNLFLPHWANLRDDPRWTELRERLGMSEETLAMLDFSPVLQYQQ